MALIFSGSGDSSSGPRSSRIIGPIVRWLVPNISDQALDTVVFAVRKTAHLTEYAILALLFYRAFQHYQSRDSRHKEAHLSDPDAPLLARRHPAFLAFAAATLYAVTDEFHQSFVPNRTGQPLDVLIDTTGAALALAFLLLVTRWRKRY